MGVSTDLAGLRASTPEVLKRFTELGRAATSDGVLDRKTKELIALALGVAARCDPCIGFHMQALVKPGGDAPGTRRDARGQNLHGRRSVADVRGQRDAAFQGRRTEARSPSAQTESPAMV